MSALRKLSFFFIGVLIYSDSVSQHLDLGATYRADLRGLTSRSSITNHYGFYYYVGNAARYFSADIGIYFGKQKRLQAKLSNYFGYSEIGWHQNTSTDPVVFFRRFKRDHMFDLLYSFSLSHDKWKLILGAGAGTMNAGTTFKYDAFRGEYDLNGDPIIRYNVKGGFRFFAPRIIVGVNYERLNFLIAANGTPDEYFEPNPSLWMEYKLTYQLVRFK